MRSLRLHGVRTNGVVRCSGAAARVLATPAVERLTAERCHLTRHWRAGKSGVALVRLVRDDCAIRLLSGVLDDVLSLTAATGGTSVRIASYSARDKLILPMTHDAHAANPPGGHAYGKPGAPGNRETPTSAKPSVESELKFYWYHSRCHRLT